MANKQIVHFTDKPTPIATDELLIQEVGGTTLKANLANLTQDKLGKVATTDLDMADNVVTQAEIKDYSETKTTPTSAAGVLTLDMSVGNVFEVIATENITTMTVSNPPITGKVGSFTLILKQDATGSRTVVWPAGTVWDSGTPPTISTAANAIDIITFMTLDGGTIWYGMLAGKGMA